MALNLQFSVDPEKAKKILGSTLKVAQLPQTQTISGVVSAAPKQTISGVTQAQPQGQVKMAQLPVKETPRGPAPVTYAQLPSLTAQHPKAQSTPDSLAQIGQPSVLDTLKQFPEGLSKVSGDIVPMFTRGAANLALSAAKGEQKLRGKIFGSESVTYRAPETLSTEGALQPLFGKEDIKGETEYGKEVLPKFAEKGPLPFLAGLTMSALDFTGAGGTKGAIKALTAANKAEDVLKILKKLNVADDLAEIYAKKIAETTNPEVVGNLLKNIEKVQGTTKFIEPTTSTSKLKLPNLAPIKEKVAESTQSLRTQFTDRLAPLKDLTSGKVTATKDPYVQARLYAGHLGKVQNRLEDLSTVLKPNKAVLNDAKQYALLERYQELAGRGITKFPDNLTPETIAAQKLALETKLGPQKLAQVQQTVEGLRNYSNRILTEAKDAGIISEDAYKAILAKNEKYVPLQRMEYLADHADDIPTGSNTFSVSSQSLVKKIKGSEKAVADPIESMIRNTYKAESLIERNKVAQKIGDLASDPQFKDVVVKLEIKPRSVAQISKKGTKFTKTIWKSNEVPSGMEKISVFRKGIKEEYAVPKAVGEAIKGMNHESTDLVTKWARFSSGMLRSGATSLNLAFLPSNIVRDFQSATLVSKVGFTPWDWAKGFAEAIRKGPDYKAFLESGGGFSGYFEGNKSLTKTVGKLTRSKISNTVRTIVNPFELIRKGAEITELAPRLGVFKRSLKKGLSGTEAAFNARNATVDFAKSGNTMRVVNQWVPFLNARLQGTINTFGAIKNNPVSSALKLTALVGLPVTVTYLNNTRRFPEVWDDIPQYEKDSNYIIIYGDEKDKDDRYTQIIKIPKADVGRIFGNVQENFLAYLDKKDRKSLDELALQIGSDISPVGFERDGKFSVGTAASGVLPPTAKAVIEGTTNTNLFTGLPIVPNSMKDASPREQYRNTTSASAKFVGDKLNISPLKIENAVSAQFGGLGRQLMDPKKAPTIISSRFSGARGGQKGKEAQQEAEKFLQEQADNKLQLNRAAQKKLEEIKNSPDPSAAYKELKKQDKKLAEKVATFKKYEDQGWESVDFVISDLQVENGQRAKFMVQQFNKLNTNEEKSALWQEYKKKGHLSKNVQKQIKYLLNNPE